LLPRTIASITSFSSRSAGVYEYFKKVIKMVNFPFFSDGGGGGDGWSQQNQPFHHKNHISKACEAYVKRRPYIFLCMHKKGIINFTSPPFASKVPI